MTTVPIEVLRAARQWATEHGHPQPDDRMVGAAFAAAGEAIARAIEVASGKRCPECGGKPASTKWKGLTRIGSCGGGHRWEIRSSEWVHPEEIARKCSGAQP